MLFLNAHLPCIKLYGTAENTEKKWKAELMNVFKMFHNDCEEINDLTFLK